MVFFSIIQCLSVGHEYSVVFPFSAGSKWHKYPTIHRKRIIMNEDGSFSFANNLPSKVILLDLVF